MKLVRAAPASGLLYRWLSPEPSAQVTGDTATAKRHNEALNLLDALVQLAVLDRDLAAPPGSPAEGERWIVKAPGSGAWSDRDNQIAAWHDGAWRFSSPRVGWLAYVVDEQSLLAWTGGAWANALNAFQRLLMLGVNTDADTSNRLAVKSDGAVQPRRRDAGHGRHARRPQQERGGAGRRLHIPGRLFDPRPVRPARRRRLHD